jgi:PII-like signaling protein
VGSVGGVQLSRGLPVVIEIADTKENIDRVLPVLDEMVSEGLLTLERVHVIKYRARPESSPT